MARFPWTTPSTRTARIPGSSLVSLAAGARVISSTAIDTRDVWSDWLLKVRCAAAPSAAQNIVRVWFVVDVGANSEFEDGSATVEPLGLPELLFPLRLTADAQLIALWGVRKPTAPFHTLLKNDTDQAFTAVAAENELSSSFYDIESV